LDPFPFHVGDALTVAGDIDTFGGWSSAPGLAFDVATIAAGAAVGPEAALALSAAVIVFSCAPNDAYDDGPLNATTPVSILKVKK